MRRTIHVLGPAVAAGLLLGWSPFVPTVRAQGTFAATASIKTDAGAQVTAPVTIVISRLATDKERDTVLAALKAGGTAGLVQSLKTMADAGYIEVGDRRTTLKYAYIRPMLGGRLVTVVAPTPIVHLGSGLPDAKPKAGFDVSLAILEIKEAGAGSGELVPAATVKISDTGSIETQDYAVPIVRLNNVQAKK